jgi:hypothetical protein
MNPLKLDDKNQTFLIYQIEHYMNSPKLAHPVLRETGF